MTNTPQTYRPRRWPTPAPPESTPIYDQVCEEYAAAANTDSTGRQLVAAIITAQQETTEVRWFGLPWLRTGRG